MPLAFFTRTQTGALISRMNNDVIGAQQALTGTLARSSTNVITVVATLAAMLVLDWRLTLMASARAPPLRILPGKAGRRLQKHPGGHGARRLHEHIMTERFNVSGALLVKLFGRADGGGGFAEGRAGAGHRRASAMYGPVFFGRPRPGRRGGHRRRLLVGGASWSSPAPLRSGTLVALAAYVTRLYAPLTEPHQRPGRRA